MRKIIPVIFLVLLLYIPGVEGENYINDPSNIPYVGDFNISSSLKAGGSDFLNFSIRNRYDGDMVNATLIVGLYEYATKNENKPVNELQNPPLLNNKLNFTYKTERISNGTVKNIQILITTNSDTSGGVYFIRLHLTFKYNNTSYIMKSKGYFAKEYWECATMAPINGEEGYYVGGINITYLGVNGVIPESSFGVDVEVKDKAEAETEIIIFILWGIIAAALSTLIISLIFRVFTKKQPIEQMRINFRNLVLVIFIICLVFSLVISWILWIAFPQPAQDSPYDEISGSIYNTAVYFRYKTTGSILANDLAMAENISRISGKTGFTNYQNEQDWVTIMGSHCEDLPPSLIEEYEIQYAIGYKKLLNEYLAYGHEYYSRFYVSLHNDRYKIYENSDMNIWFVYYNRG